MKLRKLLGVGLLTLSVAAVNAYSIDTSAISKIKPALAIERAPAGDPPGAAAAFGNTCADGGDAGLLASTGGTLGGDQTGGTDDFGDAGSGFDAEAAGCNDGGVWGVGNGGLDVILAFTVDATGPWTFTTCPGYGAPGGVGPAGGFGLDTDLAVFEDTGGGCPGDILIDCDGDGGSLCPGFTSELVDMSLTAGTTYYLLVDAWTVGSSGAFSVAFNGPCTSDQECIDRIGDDLFCTGDVSCNDGLCRFSGDPCGGSTPVCDEEARECVSCAASADPAATCGDDSDPCNGIEACDEATGGCVVLEACPDGYCQNGGCQDFGFCQFAGTECRIDADCPFFAPPNNAVCERPGTGSLTRCWDGHGLLGPNFDCSGGEVCVPDGNNEGATCRRDDCWVYATDWSAYFGPGQGFGEFAADDFTLAAAPAGRDVISYEILLICREGIGTIDGPYNVTTQLWSAVTTDPNIDPNAGLPDKPIPGTTCVFTDVPCGDGISGSPNRTSRNTLTCVLNDGAPSGSLLIDGVAFGIDNWIAYNASTDNQGFAIAGDPPLSQGVLAGSSFPFFAFSGQLPPAEGGVGWGLGAFSLTSNMVAFVCTGLVGPCCLGVAGCEMLPSDECSAQGGTFLGDNTFFTAELNCDETGDDDGVADLCDNCPNDNNVDQADCDSDGEGDACEADENDQDRDFDGVCNGVDGCPDDPNKGLPANNSLGGAPGQCGCGFSDDDTDKDGTADCIDGCINDPAKIVPGICGCNVADQGDEDDDGVLDCVDQCRGVDDAVFAPECDGAIPTVSEWGLVILALLLLVAGKVYFGRRRAMA